ncbi:MAG: glycoside hydrolase family 1 protein, partial [Proteobacteria bacterium]|nr:glycoside hydrolase family 1 protein [Pseudomonadota bacterium]
MQDFKGFNRVFSLNSMPCRWGARLFRAPPRLRFIRWMAVFLILLSTGAQGEDRRFPEKFVFGVATAPAQSEDGLNDIWTDWGKKGGIHAYLNQPIPEKRANSWSDPDPDLLLIDQLGVQGVRLGVDWGRIEPGPGRFDESALLKYRSLFQRIKAGGHKIMLTLSHHSVPEWIQKKGGWKNPETARDFFVFSKRILREFHSEVDWWITFNEPQIFTLFAYQFGIWPPGDQGGIFSFLDLPFYQGSGIRAMAIMIDAHKQIYEFAHHHFPAIRMGIAQNVADYHGATFIGKLLAPRVDSFMNWTFLDGIRGNMDFVGLNYYGAEWLSGSGVELLPEEEYSEAGRAVHPQGLLRILRESRDRYPLPILITENGIADSTDWIRPLYLAEHLAVVHRGIREGI